MIPKRLSRPAACLLTLLFSLTAATAGAQDKSKTLQIEAAGPLKGKVIYGASHAVLIGVNDYPYLPKDKWLEYAVNDVNGLKEVLVSSYGFPPENVRILTNEKATKENVLKALYALADKNRVKPNDRILVYFSGHGQTVKVSMGEMGFILPYDAKVDLDDFENASPFLGSCIKMEQVWDALESTPAKHALFLADSCYSGLAVKGKAAARIPQSVLLALTAHRAMQVITAGRKGQQSVEMARYGHGAFTYKLLEHLKAQATTPGLAFTVSDLAAYLQTAVASVTDGKQTPQFGAYKTEGEWVFITTGKPAAAPSTAGAKKEPTNAQVESVDTVAKVEVTTTPPGAKIYVDGEVVNGKLTPAIIEVDLGLAKSKDVEVGVSLDGYKAAVRKASLSRGGSARVEVALTGAAPSSAPASAPAPVPDSATAKSDGGISPGRLVAVIPTVNLSKEKVAVERDKQAAAGTEEMTKQFVVRGYKAVDPAAVAKALSDEKIDLSNRDFHTKPTLIKLGRALGADYVAFAAVNDVGQRSNFAAFTSQKEGRALLSIWVVDVKTEKAILDGLSQEGKSARGGVLAGAIGVAGSPRIVSAVGNAIKSALLQPLGPLPAGAGDKKN